MDKGWIKQWRKEKDSLIWQMPPIYYKVWRYLLMEVNYIDRPILVGGKPFLVKEGQIFTSMRQIAKDVAYKENKRKIIPSVCNIQWILSFLKKNEMIFLEPQYRKYSLISVINWPTYQGSDSELQYSGNTAKTPNRNTANDRPVDAPNKAKKELDKGTVIQQKKGTLIHSYKEVKKDISSDQNSLVFACKFFSVSKRKHEGYLKAYPNLDLLGEYERMRQWLEDNPTKRKTPRGYPRFINYWLNEEYKELKDRQPDWYEKLPEL